MTAVASPHVSLVSAYGVPIRLSANDPGVLAAMVGTLPPGWRPSRATVARRSFHIEETAGQFSVTMDGVELATHDDPRLAVELVEITSHRWLSQVARTRLFFHAGVVAVDGRAILIPGASHAGKTTLVEAFLRAGATYYTDEFAVVDRHGLVHPFPRAMRVRTVEGERLGRRAAAEFGAGCGTHPIPIALVAAIPYDPDAGWNVEERSRAHGVLALAAACAMARRRPAELMEVCSRALASATIVIGTRGAAGDAVTRLFAILASKPV